MAEPAAEASWMDEDREPSRTEAGPRPRRGERRPSPDIGFAWHDAPPRRRITGGGRSGPATGSLTPPARALTLVLDEGDVEGRPRLTVIDDRERAGAAVRDAHRQAAARQSATGPATGAHATRGHRSTSSAGAAQAPLRGAALPGG